MTLHDALSVHLVRPSALVRFVADGLLACVDSYLRGELPLHRLARELEARTDALSALGPPARTLTRLRWLYRDVAGLSAGLRGTGRAELDPGERAHLAATLGTLRDTLITLLSPPPPDPVGAGRPATGSAARAVSGDWAGADAGRRRSVGA